MSMFSFIYILHSSHRLGATCSSRPPIASKTGTKLFRGPPSPCCSACRRKASWPPEQGEVFFNESFNFSFSRKFHITDVKIHEDYNHTLQQHDIALIKSSKFLIGWKWESCSKLRQTRQGRAVSTESIHWDQYWKYNQMSCHEEDDWSSSNLATCHLFSSKWNPLWWLSHTQ